MNKKAYFQPALRIVYLDAICEGELMDGSAQKPTDEYVDDDDEFLGTRPFKFDWE
ncbi:MAG: hypothetical protein IJS89_03075 [Bacteroidaceae bacterium]|nr:hypothetical protein [Bacteroidaceae bacterium]